MSRNLGLGFAFAIVLVAFAAFGHPLVITSRVTVTDTLRIVDTVALRTVHDTITVNAASKPVCSGDQMPMTVLSSRTNWAGARYDLRRPDGTVVKDYQMRRGHAIGEQVCA